MAAPSSDRELRRLEELEARLEKNPRDQQTFDALIDAYRSTGRTLAAAELLRKRSESNPDDWVLLRDCADMYLQSQEPGRAAQTLNRAGSNFEDRWEFWDLRGRCLEGLGRYRDALEEHERAAQMAPDESDPRFHMGLACLELSEEDEAREHFQAALERDPSMSRALVNLGLLHERAGAVERAMDMFRRAVELEPGNLEGHLNLGVLYAESGRAKEAAAEFLEAAEMAPQNAEAHYNLGVLLQEADPEQALQHLRKAVSIDPAYQEARFQIGRICYRRGLYAVAIKNLKSCLETESRDPGALYYLAQTYNKLDRPDETVRLLEELLKVRPDHAQAYFLLGISYDKKGLYKKAREAYQRADELGREGEEDSPGAF